MLGFDLWMAESGLTEAEVAAAVRVDLSTIYRIRGEKRNASPDMIKVLVAFSQRLVAAGRARRPLDANDFFRLPQGGNHERLVCPFT
jgi:hypothetical protein